MSTIQDLATGTKSIISRPGDVASPGARLRSVKDITATPLPGTIGYAAVVVVSVSTVSNLTTLTVAAAVTAAFAPGAASPVALAEAASALAALNRPVAGRAGPFSLESVSPDPATAPSSGTSAGGEQWKDTPNLVLIFGGACLLVAIAVGIVINCLRRVPVNQLTLEAHRCIMRNGGLGQNHIRVRVEEPNRRVEGPNRRVEGPIRPVEGPNRRVAEPIGDWGLREVDPWCGLTF